MQNEMDDPNNRQQLAENVADLAKRMELLLVEHRTIGAIAVSESFVYADIEKDAQRIQAAARELGELAVVAVSEERTNVKTELDEVVVSPEVVAGDDGAYLHQSIKRFVLRRSQFTITDLGEYLKATEDFTHGQISSAKSKIKTHLSRIVAEESNDGRMSEHWSEKVDGKWTFTFAYRATAPSEPEIQAYVAPKEEIAADETTEQTVRALFDVKKMGKVSFSIERMSEEELHDASQFAASLFAGQVQPVLKRDMKICVVDKLNNKNVGIDEANRILDRLYAAKLVGKITSADGLKYFTADVAQRTQRTAPRQKGGINSQTERASEKSVDYVDLGVGQVIDCLVTQLQHSEQSMTPRRISQHITEAGSKDVSAESVKSIARMLPSVFTVEAKALTGKSPHAKSRKQQVLQIKLASQEIKDLWRNDPQRLLDSLDASNRP